MATPKKKHLIELMIEAGVKWPDGAEYAAQDKDSWLVAFYARKPYMGHGKVVWTSDGGYVANSIKKLDSLCRNWHQTIVTRERYAAALEDAESWNAWSSGRNPVDYHCDVEVKLRSGSVLSGIAGEFGWLHDDDGGDILYYRLIDKKEHVDKSNQVRESEDVPAVYAVEWHNPPSIEQLTADYHTKAAEVDRLQAVADEALKDADDALLALEKAGELIGLVISIDTKPKLPVQPDIVDWRDLRVGDVVEHIEDNGGDLRIGSIGKINEVCEEYINVDYENWTRYSYGVPDDLHKFRFISRP